MIKIIYGEIINEILLSEHRQYLCGDLKIPQKLEEIFDENVEVGITDYAENKTETAHYHETCSEYQYVISGETEIMDLDTDCTVKLKKGDFFVIRPKTRYFQKAKKGCRILFFKYPSGNDKVKTSLSAEQIKWGEKI